MKSAGFKMCSRSSIWWEVKCWWGSFMTVKKHVFTCFFASILGRPWDRRRQRFAGLFLSGRKSPIRFVQPTLYLFIQINIYMYILKFLFCKHNGKIAIFSHERKRSQGYLPLCTNHRAEPFRAFECVSKINPATVFTRQLGLIFFWGRGSSINTTHMSSIRLSSEQKKKKKKRHNTRRAEN